MGALPTCNADCILDRFDYHPSPLSEQEAPLLEIADFISFDQLDEIDLNLDKLTVKRKRNNNDPSESTIVGKFEEFHKFNANRPVLNTPVLIIAGRKYMGREC